MSSGQSLLAVPLILSLACGEPLAEGGLVSFTDSAGVEVVLSHNPTWSREQAWSIADSPRVSIGELNGEEPYEFYRISEAFLVPGGGIAVVHTSRPPEFRIFDEDGSHVRSIGREGEGPGEFRVLLRGWLEDGQVLLGYDPVLGRLTRFGLDGELIDVEMIQPIPPSSRLGERDWPALWFDHLSDGHLLGKPNGPTPYENGRTRPIFAFTRLNLSSLERDTVALGLGVEWLVRGLEKGIDAEMATVVFSPQSVAAANDTTVFVSDNKDFWIEEVAPGGRVLRRFGRAYESRPVTSEDRNAYRINRLARARSEDERRDAEAALRFLEFADTFPAHGTRMLVDADGNLWVVLQDSDGSVSSQWSVFNASGIWLGDVEAPTTFRITDIGTDVVVGIWTDNLDVQSIRVFDLRRPSRVGRPANDR